MSTQEPKNIDSTTEKNKPVEVEEICKNRSRIHKSVYKQAAYSRLKHFALSDTDKLTELIANSIQAAKDNESDLRVHCHFTFNKEDDISPSKITIRDESGGMNPADLSDNFSLGKDVYGIASINEHGFGMSVAVETLIRGDDKESKAKMTSRYKGETYYIEGNQFAGVTFEDQPMTDSSLEKDGVQWDFYKPNFNTIKYPPASSHTSEFHYLWTNLNAKYRYVQKEFKKIGKRFVITLSYGLGDNIVSTRKIDNNSAIIEPVLQDLTGNNDWIVSFQLGRENLVKQYGVSKASTDHNSYNQTIDGKKITERLHPYRINNKEAVGLDIIYKNIMVKQGDLEQLPLATTLVGGSRNKFIDLRGEIRYISGGQADISKRIMNRSPAEIEMDKEAEEIIRGIRPHPVTGKKINYLDFIERKTVKVSENLIRQRYLDGIQGVIKSSSTEVSNHYGQIDAVIVNKDGTKDALEFKRNEIKKEHVNQVLNYVLGDWKHGKGEYQEFKILGTGLSDTGKDAIADTNDIISKYGWNTKVVYEQLGYRHTDKATPQEIAWMEKNK